MSFGWAKPSPSHAESWEWEQALNLQQAKTMVLMSVDVHFFLWPGNLIFLVSWSVIILDSLKLVGTPSERTWPGISILPDYKVRVYRSS